jgi:hypothetical protein
MQNSLTYKQARAHAQQCGVDVSRYQAVPVQCLNRGRILARGIVNPETQTEVMPAGLWVCPEMVQPYADELGIDYIICTKG